MSLNIHNISPLKVFRGEGAWHQSLESINKLYCLENDKPVKGIENFKLEYI